MKTYEQTFSKDDRLGYAINYCIDGLEQTVAHLPKEATEEEITQATRQAKRNKRSEKKHAEKK